MKLQRYEPVGYSHDPCWAGMEPDKEGDWVNADEAEAEIARLREALANYGAHDHDCVCSQSRAGRPTEDGGYEVLYGYGQQEKWYKMPELPPCTCGFREALKGKE